MDADVLRSLSMNLWQQSPRSHPAFSENDVLKELVHDIHEIYLTFVEAVEQPLMRTDFQDNVVLISLISFV